MSDLRDELGDLLLQVVYHSQMAQEADEFSYDDVVEAICTKLIRRHPHVFGDAEARSAGAVKGFWERIKAEEQGEKQEKAGATDTSVLDGVPAALPALMRAVKLQKKASRVGFDWAAAEPVLDKIEEEIAELRDEMATGPKQAVEEELGDLMFRRRQSGTPARRGTRSGPPGRQCQILPPLQGGRRKTVRGRKDAGAIEPRRNGCSVG